MSSEVATNISKSVRKVRSQRSRRGRPITKIIVSNTQLPVDLTPEIDDSALPTSQEPVQEIQTETEFTQATESTEQSPTKVYYIASQDGSIASYNPTYILRKTGGTEFRIMLPDKAGTLALIEDVPTGLDGYVSKDDLLNAVNTVEGQYPLNGDDWTVEDLVNSHRSLMKQLKLLCGWVEPEDP